MRGGVARKVWDRNTEKLQCTDVNITQNTEQ